jgi:shikimate kinase
MADEKPMKGASMTAELKKTVVLVGMMGSGKSAIGRTLSQSLQVPCRDSDTEIENAAQRTIPEIFERDGEPFFRARESEVIERLLAGTPSVLSTGGGAFLAKRNRDAISAYGVSVLLDADLPLLWDRVRHKDTRPLLRTPDPLGTLTEIYKARANVYAQADLRVSAEPAYSIDEMTQAVIDILMTRPDVLS